MRWGRFADPVWDGRGLMSCSSLARLAMKNILEGLFLDRGDESMTDLELPVLTAIIN